MAKTEVLSARRSGAVFANGELAWAGVPFVMVDTPLSVTEAEPPILKQIDRASVGADQFSYQPGRVAVDWHCWSDFSQLVDQHFASLEVLRTRAGLASLSPAGGQRAQVGVSVADVDVIDPPDTPRQIDEPGESGSDDLVSWLAGQDELLRHYAGEWVAFDGRTIVAHAPSFLEVMREVESRGIHDPFLVPVAPARPFVG